VRQSLKLLQDDPNQKSAILQSYLNKISDYHSLGSEFSILGQNVDTCLNEEDEVIPEEVVITQNLPEGSILLDGLLQDIVYIGDREVEFYRYGKTLYIVDP
jgi:hypothetical protein